MRSSQQVKLPMHAPLPGLEDRFPRLRLQTRKVFDLVISHLNAALAAAVVDGVLRKQVFDALKESHRLQCMAAVRAYIFQDIAGGTSKYSHNTHTLVNARKLLAEYQREELPWFPELHHCGQGNNNESWLACPELQDLCQSEQNDKRAAAVHQLKWVVDLEPMHLQHLDILVANFFDSEALADGTPLQAVAAAQTCVPDTTIQRTHLHCCKQRQVLPLQQQEQMSQAFPLLLVLACRRQGQCASLWHWCW